MSDAATTTTPTADGPPPKGAGEIEALLRRVSEEIAFGKVKIADGSKKLVAEAEDILSRG